MIIEKVEQLKKGKTYYYEDSHRTECTLHIDAISVHTQIMTITTEIIGASWSHQSFDLSFAFVQNNYLDRYLTTESHDELIEELNNRHDKEIERVLSLDKDELLYWALKQTTFLGHVDDYSDYTAEQCAIAAIDKYFPDRREK